MTATTDPQLDPTHSNGHSEDNPFDFDSPSMVADLAPKEVRGIRWKGNNYILKEATEDAHIKHTNQRLKHLRHNEHGEIIGMAGGAETDLWLLSVCMFQIVINPRGEEVYKPVTEQSLRTEWPPKIVNKLILKCKEISDIEQRKSRPERIKALEQELAQLRKEQVDEEERVRKLKDREEGDVGNPLGATTDTSV